MRKQLAEGYSLLQPKLLVFHSVPDCLFLIPKFYTGWQWRWVGAKSGQWPPVDLNIYSPAYCLSRPDKKGKLPCLAPGWKGLPMLAFSFKV